MPSAEASARGTTKKEKRADNVAGGRLARALGGEVPAAEMHWDDVDPRYIAWLVTVATRIGGAVTFGRSRDGGALMVTVLLDGERSTTWIAPRDDVVAKITYIAEVLGTLA